jgi:hypothetical protein
MVRGRQARSATHLCHGFVWPDSSNEALAETVAFMQKANCVYRLEQDIASGDILVEIQILIIQGSLSLALLSSMSAVMGREK